MEIKKLFEDNKFAADVIREWYIKKLSENSTDAPEEFVEAMKDRIDGMIISVAENNPSVLFSIFDQNDIFIFTVPLDDNLFGYKIFTGSTTKHDSPLIVVNDDNFPVRKCAEKAAIIEAVKIMDKKHQTG